MNTLAKLTVILFLGFINSHVNAQTNFEKGMAKAFKLWQSNNMEEAENLFERIAKAEPNEWLPNYYVAQINSLKSWNQKDETILKAQLDKAQEHLDIAMGKRENHPELLVLQAHVFTNWIAFDGMKYGMKYSGKVNELYEKASKLAPENPRVVFSKAEWDMGSARYFGKDTTPYCKDIKRSIELFANFKPESEFHPNWGKERAEQVLKTCE